MLQYSCTHCDYRSPAITQVSLTFSTHPPPPSSTLLHPLLILLHHPPLPFTPPPPHSAKSMFAQVNNFTHPAVFSPVPRLPLQKHFEERAWERGNFPHPSFTRCLFILLSHSSPTHDLFLPVLTHFCCLSPHPPPLTPLLFFLFSHNSLDPYEGVVVFRVNGLQILNGQLLV